MKTKGESWLPCVIEKVRHCQARLSDPPCIGTSNINNIPIKLFHYDKFSYRRNLKTCLMLFVYFLVQNI